MSSSRTFLSFRTQRRMMGPQCSGLSIGQYRYGLDNQSIPFNRQLAASNVKINSDGLYYVMRAEHTGDTRGTNWYTDLTCLAVDATAPLNNVQQAAISPSTAVPRY